MRDFRGGGLPTGVRICFGLGHSPNFLSIQTCYPDRCSRMLRSPRRPPEVTHPSGNSECLEAPPTREESALSSDAPIASENVSESQTGEHQPEKLVNIGTAARTLGISAEEVMELCEAGALKAQRTRNRFWLIDEQSLLRWREANPEIQSKETPCPHGACEGHWSRRGQIVPAFRADLCLRCYSGRPLPMMAADE